MSPERPRHHRQRGPEPLEAVMQVRFTRAQADALRAIAVEYDWRGPGPLIRSIVGTWLIQRDELQGPELEAAIEQLRALEAED